MPHPVLRWPHMLITAIGALSLAATSPPAPAHDLWVADVILPEMPASVYVVQFPDPLESATKNFGIEWFDVVDAHGKTMPRGFWISPGGDGFHRNVPLALSDKRERHVAPQMCEVLPHPAECAVFDRDADPTAWVLSQQMPQNQTLGVGRISVTGSAGARPPAFGNANGGAFGARPTPTNPSLMPLHWDVIDIAAPPADAADWSSRALLLKWKSRLTPEAVAWQIGRDTATITRGDLASLKENDMSLDGWRERLVGAWHRAGRFMTFGPLRNVQHDGDVFSAEVMLKGLVGNDALQIATAPAGAVDIVEVRLAGVAPRALPPMGYAEQPVHLAPMPDGAGRVTDAWPRSATSVTLRFPPPESRAMMDANILKIEYQALTASGRVKNVALNTLLAFVDTNPLSGITGSTPIDPADPWTQLQQVKPTQALPLPELFAVYTTRALWFEAAGTAPYQVKFGVMSARRPEQMDSYDADQLGVGQNRPADTVHLPTATLQNLRKTGSVAAISARAMEPMAQASRDHWLAIAITLLATLAFVGLAAIDRNLRRKIAALRRSKP